MNGVYLDIETTGFKAEKGAEITEIGGMKVVNNKIIAVFSSLCFVHGEISDFITNLTGINKEMTNNAPPFHTVFCNFMESLAITEKTNLIIHNVPFDYNFLKYYVNHNKFNKLYVDRFYNLNTVCTLDLSRRLLPNQSHKLDDLKKHFGIQNNKKAHRALADCQVTYQVHRRLLELKES